MNFISVSLHRFAALFLCSCLLFVLSCQKEDPIIQNVDQKSQSDDPMLAHLLKMGFTTDKIKDAGQHYVVEGDMIFSKKGSENARPAQRGYNDAPYPSLTKVGNIKVAVGSFPNSSSHPNMRADVIAALQLAMTEWNNIQQCAVNFVYTTDASISDVDVVYDSNLTGVNFAQTEVAAGCSVGYEVRLGTAILSATAGQLRFLVTHELGHTIGFLHTDGLQLRGRSFFIIPGTNQTDPNSVMNSGEGRTTIPEWSAYPNGFSAGDITAAQFLYLQSRSVTAVHSRATNPGPHTVNVTWPPSWECIPIVEVLIKNGNTNVATSGVIDNRGSWQFRLDAVTLSSGVGYDVIVRDPDDTSGSTLISTDLSF